RTSESSWTTEDSIFPACSPLAPPGERAGARVEKATNRARAGENDDVNWICSHCGEKYLEQRTRCSLDGQRVVEDLAGQTIGGRYRIRELIGVGGMDSTVWKAWQAGTERTVAIKVLPPADDDAAKRFSRGARIAANLSHPN